MFWTIYLSSSAVALLVTVVYNSIFVYSKRVVRSYLRHRPLLALHIAAYVAAITLGPIFLLLVVVPFVLRSLAAWREHRTAQRLITGVVEGLANGGLVEGLREYRKTGDIQLPSHMGEEERSRR